MFEWLKNMFNKFVAAFKSFISTAFTVGAQIAIGELKGFAISTIYTLAQSDLSNEKKRDAAFKTIKAEALVRGNDLKDSMINTIIEIALQYVKNTTR